MSLPFDDSGCFKFTFKGREKVKEEKKWGGVQWEVGRLIIKERKREKGVRGRRRWRKECEGQLCKILGSASPSEGQVGVGA